MNVRDWAAAQVPAPTDEQITTELRLIGVIHAGLADPDIADIVRDALEPLELDDEDELPEPIPAVQFALERRLMSFGAFQWEAPIRVDDQNGVHEDAPDDPINVPDELRDEWGRWLKARERRRRAQHILDTKYPYEPYRWRPAWIIDGNTWRVLDRCPTT